MVKSVPRTPLAEADAASPDSFAARPWLAADVVALEAGIEVPTMLAREERLFYTWAARDWANGAGALVDLGAFAGGSTARLAAGAVAGGHGGMVHAYDRFTAKEETKRKVLYAAGVPAFEGNDILPLAQRFLAPWSAALRYHVGHIPDLGWPGGPIDVLAVDAAKIATTTDLMAEEFLPSLVPGRSLVIQQDFLHWSQPWLPAQMWRLRDNLHPVAFVPKDSVVFLCTKEIDPEALKAARIAYLTDRELIEDVRAMRDALPESWGLAPRFRKMVQAVRANPGERIAWKMRPPPPPNG